MLIATGVVVGVRTKDKLAYRNTVDNTYLLNDITTKDFRITTEDNAELYVRVLGHGEPYYLFSHCWTGDHRIWYKVAGSLAKNSTVVLYDHRGHGKSTVGSNFISLDLLASDLQTVMNSVDAPSWIVAGHSMGGITLQKVLVDNSEKVKAAVLVSTMAKPKKEFRRLMEAGAEILRMPAVDSLIEKNIFGPLALRMAFGKNPSDFDLVLMRDTFLACDPSIRGGLLKVFAGLNLKDDLSKIEVPTFVLVGKKDRLTPPGLAKSIAQNIRNSTLLEVDNAGHMLPLEAPDLVVEALMRASG